MASLASLASLGSVRPSSSCYFEGSSQLVRRISISSKGGVSFLNCPNGQKWNCAWYANNKEFFISLDSTLRDENNAADLLEPPVLNGCTTSEFVYIPPKKPSVNSIVFEKAEKLETTSTARRSVVVVVVLLAGVANRKAKTLKSVWHKRELVASVQKVKGGRCQDRGGGVKHQASTPLKPPQPPQRVQPMLYNQDPLLLPLPVIKKPKETVTAERETMSNVKRSGASVGSRRSMSSSEIPDDDSSELNLKIKGAARKGRKWSKGRKALLLRWEILEVEEDGMSTEELSFNLAISEGEILDGVQKLDRDMVKMVCKEYEVEVIDAAHVGGEEKAGRMKFSREDLDKLEDRTTLLDYIRKSKVTASEAGGITQEWEAYKVLVPVKVQASPCVFLDTSTWARVTDIAIIVVAADDGVPRHKNKMEAIAHAKAAGVPIVVAINKIDKDGASPERVMQELSSIGLMPEDWGGDVPMVQLQELKANPHRNAKGTVIEAGLHKSKGPVATLIVQKGTLKRGDVIARALFDDSGAIVDKVGPSTVQVLGFSSVPTAGDEFEVTRAVSLRDERISSKAAAAVSAGKQAGIDLHQLNVVMKVDLQGSIEAIRQALQVLPQDNVTLKFLLQATGDISASDVDLAVAAGKAIIIGFNVKVPNAVNSHADNKGVEIRLYRVIYGLIDDMRKAMEGLLDPVEEQIPIGAAEIRAVFSSGSGRVAGCMITDGKIVKGCGIRILRNGKTIHVGVVDSLRRVKEVVKEVNAGLECGVGIDDYTDWEAGDTIEAFNSVQKQRSLEEASSSMAAAISGEGY
ncbi:hypothetical protein MKW92_028577 [Papaver armeniacum]|nr:hypothetical protein MKW92_028577 [Papaver armeniacum]